MSSTYVRRSIPDGGVRLASILDKENKQFLDKVARSYRMSTSAFLDSFIEHLRDSENLAGELSWLPEPYSEDVRLPIAS